MSFMLAALAALGAPQPSAAPEDTLEEIAEDAARDLKDSRFYNRPGATRAEYDSDWQECRLIARGSRTPRGTVPVFYNSAVISPVAAGAAAGVGGLIGAAIAQGSLRRANRQSCLLVKGWRLVEVDTATRQRLAAMSDAQREIHFSDMVGASEVEGEVLTFQNALAVPRLAAGIDPGAAVTAPRALAAAKAVNLDAPINLAPGQGMILVGFRRPDNHSIGKSATVNFARYDAEAGDLQYQPRDWKKNGDRTTYHVGVRSRDKQSGLELHLLPVTAGRYVLTSAQPGPHEPQAMPTFCLGAPSFEVGDGEIVYFGDFTPYVSAPGAKGGRLWTIPMSSDIDSARQLLATRQPTLAQGVRTAKLENDATFACMGQGMTAYRIAQAASGQSISVASSDTR